MMTDDMTRLCTEIVAMRRRRGQLLDDLAAGSSRLQHSVSDLCRHFGSERAAMARETKTDRSTFLHNLKNTVNQHLRETRSDLAGARRAWSGG